MMRAIQFSMPERLLLEYGVSQVPRENIPKRYDMNIVKIKYYYEAMQNHNHFLGQIAFGDCAGFTQSGWNRKEAVYILPRSQRWLELQPHYFIDR